MPAQVPTSAELADALASRDAADAVAAANIAALTQRVNAAETTIAQLATRVTALEAATEPPPTPPVLDARFGTSGNVALTGTDGISVDGKLTWKRYNSSYGSGNAERQYHKPEAWRMDADGITVVGERAPSGSVPSGYSFRSGFAGSRDVGVWLPLFCRVTIEARVPRFVEVWPALWMRHARGSSFAEIDIMELWCAQISGDVSVSTLHYMGGAGGTNLHRNRFALPMDGGFHTWTCEVRPYGAKGAEVAFAVDGKPPLTTNSSQWYGGQSLFRLADASGLIDGTADRSAAWDLALNQSLGGNWVADPLVPYAGKLQNGQTAKPLGPTVVTWRPAERAEMTIRRVTVEAL